MEIQDLKEFKIIFSKNLSSLIENNFKNQKEFAASFNEKTPNVSKWCNGNALPDLYKIYKICKTMSITIDSLIDNESPINYILFDEIMELVNNYAKKHRIKKVGSKEYLSSYYAVHKFIKISPNKISVKEAFEILEDILLSKLRNNF